MNGVWGKLWPGRIADSREHNTGLASITAKGTAFNQRLTLYNFENVNFIK
jgi:hypothetical protein